MFSIDIKKQRGGRGGQIFWIDSAAACRLGVFGAVWWRGADIQRLLRCGIAHQKLIWPASALAAPRANLLSV